MTQKHKPLLVAALGIVVAGLGTMGVMSMKMQPAGAEPGGPVPGGAAPTAAAPGTTVAAEAGAGPVIGQAAPKFSVKDTSGKVRTLDEFKGKYVVLEWLNYGCPFVKKHYGSGNMQKLQADTTKDGVVWLSVNTSAEGKQGYSTPAQADALTKEHKASPTAVLLDTDGVMGKTYGAKTTPHMFVINPEGKLVYNGAIDDKPSTDVADIAGAKNYVLAALEQSNKGQPVAVSISKPYGCSVKYKDE